MTEKIETLKELEHVAQILPAPIYWEDLNSVVLGANQMLLDAVGASREGFIGKTPYDFYPHEMADNIVQHNNLVIKTGKTLAQEELIKDMKTGELKYFTAIKVPLFDALGNIIGVLGTSIDITAQKENERLRLENEVSEQKAQTAALLAASIAHEMRTPLASINLGSSQLENILPRLLSAYDAALEQGWIQKTLTKEELEFVSSVGSQLKRTVYSANVFINMMLMKVSLQKPKGERMIALSAVEAVSHSLAAYPFQENEKHLVSWNLEENGPQDFYFRGGQNLFDHIFFNLLKNALYQVKKADKGSIRIWLHSDHENNFIHFKDTGPGIPPEDLVHIFEVFYSQTAHGTGIGLALCKMIMKEFGGRIFCDSVAGEYTHFILQFPKTNFA